jgi:hypothetical protein
MYDLIQAPALENGSLPRELDSYDALILSNVTEMDDEFVSLIDHYVKDGGRLLVTGFPGIYDGKDMGNKVDGLRLQCLGVMPHYQMFPRTRSTYLTVPEEDKEGLGRMEFKDFDLIMMNSEFLECQPRGKAKSFLRLVPNTMHGPPEKCYFTDADVTDIPGIVVSEFGNGKSVFIPWQVGSQYNWKGNNAQRALFLASLRNLLRIEDQITTDSSPLIEMTHLGNRNGAFEWIGMINHSGQVGDVFREPVPIYNSTVRFKPLKPVKAIHLTRSGKNLKFREKEGRIECVVPRIDDFEMILCLYK